MGISAATAASVPREEIDLSPFEVSPSELDALVAHGGVEVIEVDIGGDDPEASLEKRANCGSLETCVGHRCVRLVCMPASRFTTTCITYKYGPC